MTPGVRIRSDAGVETHIWLMKIQRNVYRCVSAHGSVFCHSVSLGGQEAMTPASVSRFLKRVHSERNQGSWRNRRKYRDEPGAFAVPESRKMLKTNKQNNIPPDQCISIGSLLSQMDHSDVPY